MKEAFMRAGRFSILMIVVVFTAAFSMPVYADQYTETAAFYQKSKVVQPFFKSAYGYAVFPSIRKGGLGIGGAYGNGLVYRGGKVTGVASLMKVSIGFQAGGQAFNEIIFFEDKRAFDEFTSGEFALDATASAVAITAGAQAKAGMQGSTAGASTGPATDVQAAAGYYKGMAVFVHSLGGLMFEASVGGQKFEYTPIQARQ
jgi:lipid-binding SYLF domain-containing protein